MSPHTWDCRQASSQLEFQVCTLTPGITRVHLHTWDCKGALSYLGLQVWTLTPGFHGIFFFEEHAEETCSVHRHPPSPSSHLHCSRSTRLDFLADLLPFVTSLPFYKTSHTCFLQAQLRGCRKLYENKSILYSKHAWCPCQAISFPGCRHQRSYASFLLIQGRALLPSPTRRHSLTDYSSPNETVLCCEWGCKVQPLWESVWKVFQYQDKGYCMTQLEEIDSWVFTWWTPNQHVRETLVHQQIYVFNTGGMDKNSVAYKYSGLMFQ